MEQPALDPGMGGNVANPERIEYFPRFRSGRQGKLMVIHPVELAGEIVFLQGTDEIGLFLSASDIEIEFDREFPMIGLAVLGEDQIKFAETALLPIDPDIAADNLDRRKILQPENHQLLEVTPEVEARCGGEMGEQGLGVHR